MLISVIVECKYNDPDSRLFKGLFTLLPGRKTVLKQVQTQFLPSKAALQYQCTAVRRESAASGRKDVACTAAEQADQRSHLAASPGPTTTQESPQARQLLFVEHNHLEQVGVAPAVIMDPALPASSPSQLLLSLVLPSASLEWGNSTERESELGLGLRRRVMECCQEQGASGQGEGWVLKSAGGAAVWSK